MKIGTIFEASHIPMNVWLQAMFLVASSKKGISSNQLHRMLGKILQNFGVNFGVINFGVIINFGVRPCLLPMARVKASYLAKTDQLCCSSEVEPVGQDDADKTEGRGMR